MQIFRKDQTYQNARLQALLHGGMMVEAMTQMGRWGLALVLAAQLACLPEVKERCRLLTDPIPVPALPADLARLDGLLLRRARETTLASRSLTQLEVWQFR